MAQPVSETTFALLDLMAVRYPSLKAGYSRSTATVDIDFLVSELATITDRYHTNLDAVSQGIATLAKRLDKIELNAKLPKDATQHDGAGMPASLRGRYVDIYFRDGTVGRNQKADNYDWKWCGLAGDIVGYIPCGMGNTPLGSI